jgi:hypothetical protein
MISFYTPLVSYLFVGLFVEIAKQEVKHDGMSADPVNKHHWEVAWIVENQLKSVNHDGYELCHLLIKREN